MANYDVMMGKCTCTNIFHCAEVQNQVISSADTIMHGCFEIKCSESEKIGKFRKKCIYHLGPLGNEVANLRVMKFHFNVSVLQYLDRNRKRITSPISRQEAIKEGLLEFVVPYTKNKYFFVPNVSYNDAETNLNMNRNKESKKREREEKLKVHLLEIQMRKKRKTIVEEKHEKNLRRLN